VLESILDFLNIKHLSPIIPNEFKTVFNEEKYEKSQLYLKEKTTFTFIKSTFFLILTFSFIILGGFNSLDLYIRSYNLSSLLTGVTYLQALILFITLLSIPFSLYSTFVIEKKFGFNKTTINTFFLDSVKSVVLTILIGCPILFSILWFFETFPNYGWLYTWGFIVLVQLIIIYVAPTYIMPLFNKFKPIEEGELKNKIETYAVKYNFQLSGIYTMDGSKRSTKSNAFFTGFGKNRRIVLFDTLIKNHSTDELLCILAHEMGHFKLKHIHKSIIVSFLTTGLMLYLLSIFLNNPHLTAAFKVDTVSTYTSLIFFSFLFKPIEEILGVINNVLSRKHEYEADRFAIVTTGMKTEFINALKKLSVDNLSNLTPHWLKVFFEYSHPPLIKRIDYIKTVLIK
tara:strand:+ start:2830 stop:4023 length:1194 start_codon:yes stop_codon:yes gene_type:complete